MVEITALWLPILASAAIVFVASSVIWMVLPHHRSDYKGFPDENAATGLFRGLAPGVYMFPYAACHNKDGKEYMKSDAFKQKMQNGPWGTVTLMPKCWNMGKCLAIWFVHLLIVSAFIAYVAGVGLEPGTKYLTVFRVCGAAAFLAFVLPSICEGVWKGRPWSHVVKDMADGVVYSLLLAGTFAWLWPDLAVAAPAVPGLTQ